MKASPWLTLAIGVIKTDYLSELFGSISCWENPCQIIVIDDRADPLAEKLNIPIKPQHEVLLITNPANLGALSPAKVWNLALKEAKAPWFCVAGDDDLFGPGWDQTMWTLARSYPEANVLRSRLRVLDGSGKTREWGPMMPTFEPWYEILYARNWHDRLMSLGEHVFKTDALKALGGFEELPAAWGSDDLALLSMAMPNPVVSSNDAWYGWRYHPGSITASKITPSKRQAIDELIAKLRKLVETHGNKLSDNWLSLLSIAVNRRYSLEKERFHSTALTKRVKRRIFRIFGQIIRHER